LRLATFNLMSGRSLADGLVDEGRLYDAIAGLDADVLALQEVDRDQPRSNGLDLTAVAAAATGAVASRFAATMLGLPEQWRPARDDDGDHRPDDPARYGVALVSRWPVRAWYVRRLRAAPVRAPIFVPGQGGGLIMLNDEPRLVLAAVIDAPTGPMTVACTHLSFVPGWNVGQLTGTLRWLRGLPAPRFLLGDLNLPSVATLPCAAANGWRLLARRPTYPAPRPRVQFDHILAHPRRHLAVPPPARIRVSTPAIPVSDHRPLMVELAV
jgi:endonuclease/exonuclease/phosphatase family metal-dependent hydrolase